MAKEIERPRPSPLPILALVLSVLGVAGFIYLFVRDFNIYWLILSPVIFAVYQLPAVAVFWLYKKRRAMPDAAGPEAPPAVDEAPADGGPGSPV